jgi:hypothetical protein
MVCAVRGITHNSLIIKTLRHCVFEFMFFFNGLLNHDSDFIFRFFTIFDLLETAFTNEKTTLV